MQDHRILVSLSFRHSNDSTWVECVAPATSQEESGPDSLIDPADALRKAMTVSAVLEYKAAPHTPEEVAEVLELKVFGQ